MGKLLKNPDRTKIWTRAFRNERGHLAQGNKYGVKVIHTIRYIAPSDVPTDQKVTYASSFV